MVLASNVLNLKYHNPMVNNVFLIVEIDKLKLVIFARIVDRMKGRNQITRYARLTIVRYPKKFYQMVSARNAKAVSELQKTRRGASRNAVCFKSLRRMILVKTVLHMKEPKKMATHVEQRSARIVKSSLSMVLVKIAPRVMA